MPHYFESGFSAYKPFWHGLGTQVAGSLTGEQALKTAKLNWQTIILPCYDENGKKLPTSCQRVVRQTDHQFFSSCGSAYTPVQNSQLFDLAEALIGEGARFETAGSLKCGLHVWCLVSLGEMNIVGDKMNSWLLCTNKHEPGNAMMALETTTRTECWNTLSIALGEKTENVFRLRHTGDVTARIEQAKRLMQGSRAWMEKFHSLCTVLAETRVDSHLLKVIADQIIPEADTEAAEKRRQAEREVLIGKLVSQAGAKTKAMRGTAYGMLNAITEYADHHLAAVPEKSKDFTAARERHFMSVVSGAAAEFKQAGVDILLRQLVDSDKMAEIIGEDFEWN